MREISEDTPEEARLRSTEVETKLDAIVRHVADAARIEAEASRLIAILRTGMVPPPGSNERRTAA